MREKLTRAFLWIGVLGAGLVVGAKLFDLRVLVGAWSASPPGSLQLLPYGPRWPVDTGEFFIPMSAAMLLSTLGATLAGWRTPPRFRWLLLAPFLLTVFNLVVTVTMMWPRNAALWAVARNADGALTDPAAIQRMVDEWVAIDWGRVAIGFVAWICLVRAISVPFPALEPARPATLATRIGYAAAVAAVIAFVAWFVSKV